MSRPFIHRTTSAPVVEQKTANRTFRRFLTAAVPALALGLFSFVATPTQAENPEIWMYEILLQVDLDGDGIIGPPPGQEPPLPPKPPIPPGGGGGGNP